MSELEKKTGKPDGQCESCAGCGSSESSCCSEGGLCVNWNVGGCPDDNQPCTSCGRGCPSASTNGCGGCCPHAAGNEFEWDYDDTVLVFSSDMLEESP